MQQKLLIAMSHLHGGIVFFVVRERVAFCVLCFAHKRKAIQVEELVSEQHCVKACLSQLVTKTKHVASIQNAQQASIAEDWRSFGRILIKLATGKLESEVTSDFACSTDKETSALK